MSENRQIQICEHDGCNTLVIGQRYCTFHEQQERQAAEIRVYLRLHPQRDDDQEMEKP